MMLLYFYCGCDIIVTSKGGIVSLIERTLRLLFGLDVFSMQYPNFFLKKTKLIGTMKKQSGHRRYRLIRLYDNKHNRFDDKRMLKVDDEFKDLFQHTLCHLESRCKLMGKTITDCNRFWNKLKTNPSIKLVKQIEHIHGRVYLCSKVMAQIVAEILYMETLCPNNEEEIVIYDKFLDRFSKLYDEFQLWKNRFIEIDQKLFPEHYEQ